MSRWYDSRYTGLFTEFGKVARRAYDPDVTVFAGTLPAWGARARTLAIGGAGWNEDSAELAAAGEGIERLQPYALPCDGRVGSSFNAWLLDEPAIAPQSWVLFHPHQYAQADFTFRPFTADSVCSWVCFREAFSGRPFWIPADFAYLSMPVGSTHHIAPATSTGTCSGRWGDGLLLRGLQEVIERDAVIGAWWGSYGLEEFDSSAVLDSLGPETARRILRPNLRYRFYRVDSPFSAHVTMVTLEGVDREGGCFSVGTACRETREASWQKAILEAIHSRYYVRYLWSRSEVVDAVKKRRPADFEEHTLYYSVHPDLLPQTVLHQARPVTGHVAAEAEDLPALVDRLGRARPVLFRNMTPPGIASAGECWYVLKVVVPGLTPLHGSDQYAHLGSSLWQPRGLAEWSTTPPHPFP